MKNYNVFVPRLVTKKEYFAPGHRACIGCAEALAVRLAAKVMGQNVIVANATGCIEIIASQLPYTSWRVPWIHTLFENTAAVLDGDPPGAHSFERSRVKIILKLGHRQQLSPEPHRRRRMARPKLTDVKGIGDATAARLAEHKIRSVKAIAEAPKEKLAKVPGFGASRAAATIKSAKALMRAEARKSAAKLKKKAAEKAAKTKKAAKRKKVKKGPKKAAKVATAKRTKKAPPKPKKKPKKKAKK